MRALIAGTGRIEDALAAALRGHGHDVVCVENDDEGLGLDVVTRAHRERSQIITVSHAALISGGASELSAALSDLKQGPVRLESSRGENATLDTVEDAWRVGTGMLADNLPGSAGNRVIVESS